MLTRKDAEALAREVRAVPDVAGSWHSGRLVARAGQVAFGDPCDDGTTMGPLISQAQRARVMRYIQLGKDEGATLRTTDVSRAHAVARRIRAGAVAVNGWSPLTRPCPGEAPGSAAMNVNSAGPASRRTPKRRPSRSSSERHQT